MFAGSLFGKVDECMSDRQHPRCRWQWKWPIRCRETSAVGLIYDKDESATRKPVGGRPPLGCVGSFDSAWSWKRRRTMLHRRKPYVRFDQGANRISAYDGCSDAEALERGSCTDGQRPRQRKIQPAFTRTMTMVVMQTTGMVAAAFAVTNYAEQCGTAIRCLFP